MRKALVTGGAGFIGSHLVKSLVENGWRVAVVDDMSSGKFENLAEKVKFRTVLPVMLEQFIHTVELSQEEVLLVTGDMIDLPVVYHLQNHDYTHVFHLAASTDPEFSVNNPATSTLINVQKTVELMSACRHIDLQYFVFASSVEVESKSPHLHGVQKSVSEQMMETFGLLYNMDVTAVRIEDSQSAETCSAAVEALLRCTERDRSSGLHIFNTKEAQ